MPKIYERSCDFCGQKYVGYGVKYCSEECSQKDRKKETKQKEPLDDIPPEGERIVEKRQENDVLMTTVTARESDAVKTLPELMEVCEVDEDVWEVANWQAKNWNGFYKDEETQSAVVVPLFSVNARFERRKDVHINQALENVLKEIADYAPVYENYDREDISVDQERNLLELVLPDLHLGMLAWDRETGEDYDSYIASHAYLNAIDALIERAKPFYIEKILLIVGNDFLHTDQEIEGKGGATARGTPQDVDSRRAKMIEMGCDLLVETVDRLLNIAPVEIVGVPGNHDYTETVNIVRYLKAWYRNCDDVTVDAEPSPRKYFRYGNNLLGFTHGDKEKVKNLPIIMAQEASKEWADTYFREFHLGHNHRKKEYSTVSVNEKVGVRTRHLSALTKADAWHKKRGYVANIRAAEAFVWNYEEGLAAILNWNVPFEDE